ncbi:hypothetical protein AARONPHADGERS_21 [Bacillus phage AaronPhadgers]|nr:hypothetical protein AARONPHADGERS_21 [Bacillus phage AaronPhadgers]AXF41978.1 hypothetical protein [Bacillus phage Saddex]QDH50005.1 hypothetical protein ALPS_18 [Bacillus phage ALPS]
MTRHTRNRQRRLAAEMETGLNHDFFMKDKNLTIARYRNALTGRELDVTFKWVRMRRRGYTYDEVNGITEFMKTVNTISWITVKDGERLKHSMNPKSGSLITYSGSWGV